MYACECLEIRGVGPYVCVACMCVYLGACIHSFSHV